MSDTPSIALSPEALASVSSAVVTALAPTIKELVAEAVKPAVEADIDITKVDDSKLTPAGVAHKAVVKQLRTAGPEGSARVALAYQEALEEVTLENIEYAKAQPHKPWLLDKAAGVKGGSRSFQRDVSDWLR